MVNFFGLSCIFDFSKQSNIPIYSLIGKLESAPKYLQTLPSYFFIVAILIFVSWSECFSQSLEDFKVEHIGRQVKDFQLDSINLSSPLNYYLSRVWVRLSGKSRLWNDISTSKFSFNADAPDEDVDDKFRPYVLNEQIDCIVTYRDSVATVITHANGEDVVMLNNSVG